MVGTVLGFNQRFERIGELVVVLGLGACLWTITMDKTGLLLAFLLFFIIRPISVFVGLAGTRCPCTDARLIAWFGIRGVGSLYYLMFPLHAGVPLSLMEQILSLVVTVVAASIAVHGISATPLMARAKQRKHKSGKR